MYQQLSLNGISSSLFLTIAEYFADWMGTCLLYSGGNLDSAQSSFLGLFPFETITVYHQQLSYKKGNKEIVKNVQNPWEGLQELFFASLAQDPQSMSFGWFGYGMGAFADIDKTMPYRSSSIPDAYWQRCAVLLKLDLQMQKVDIVVDLSVIEHISKEEGDWVRRFALLKGWQDFIRDLSCRTLISETIPDANPFLDIPERKNLYLHKVRHAQELIRSGEIYQVNLSQNFDFQSSRHPFSLFRQVCELNPAPFSAYFRYEKLSIVSTSPERFLCKKDQRLEARPIKGTIQRGKSAEEDQRLKMQLLSSAKERAELLMITDLMRNDLGKISKVGSVQTLELWRCEAYENVFHLLSIIRSEVKPDLLPLEIVRACFPGGSITGCPKLRAMEVIDELEERPRGIYTGSIGYFTGQGNFDLNIAIRTLVAAENSFSLQLGGGIVIDSDPEKEYQETIFKGASIFRILQNLGIKQEKKFYASRS